MPYSDLPLADLEAYRPSIPEPGDFDEFWSRTLHEARQHDLAPVRVPTRAPITELIIEDLTFLVSLESPFGPG